MSASRDGDAAPELHESIHGENARLALGWWPDPEQLPIRSVVQGDHQLIFNTFAAGRDELYDVAADPMAQHDLAGEKPELAAQLRELGLQAMRENRPIVREGEDAEMKLDPDIRDELRALGYER